MRPSGVAAASLSITFGAIGAFAYFNSRDTGNSDPSKAVVVRVVDGDTLQVRIGGRQETVRLIGVDTPETVKPGAPVDCFGPEASAYTKSVLKPGTEVRLERDVEARDKYNRLLAYVYIAEGNVFFNEDLLKAGFAVSMRFPPNTAFAEHFDAVVAEAKDSGVGLWGVCNDASG